MKLNESQVREFSRNLIWKLFMYEMKKHRELLVEGMLKAPNESVILVTGPSREVHPVVGVDFYKGSIDEVDCTLRWLDRLLNDVKDGRELDYEANTGTD